MSFRSPKLLKAARGRPCVICGSVETTVSAHSTRVDHGHGTGIKAPDFMIAFLCHTHHDEVDGRRGTLSKDDRHELWLRAFVKTIAVMFEQGIVVVK